MFLQVNPFFKVGSELHWSYFSVSLGGQPFCRPSGILHLFIIVYVCSIVDYDMPHSLEDTILPASCTCYIEKNTLLIECFHGRYALLPTLVRFWTYPA